MMPCHAHNDVPRIARDGDPELKKLKEKNSLSSWPSISSEVLVVCESYKCFEFGSHWQDEASTSRGAQLFGAPAAKTARGDDYRSGVPDDASFSTLGTEILVHPVRRRSTVICCQR